MQSKQARQRGGGGQGEGDPPTPGGTCAPSRGEPRPPEAPKLCPEGRGGNLAGGRPVDGAGQGLSRQMGAVPTGLLGPHRPPPGPPSGDPGPQELWREAHCMAVLGGPHCPQRTGSKEMASCLRAEPHVRSRAGTGPRGEKAAQAEDGLRGERERPSCVRGGVRRSWPWGASATGPAQGPSCLVGSAQSTAPGTPSLPPGEG